MLDSRDHRENDISQEKRISDEAVLEAFISDLEGEEEAQTVIDSIPGEQSVEATIEYTLLDPYDKKKFWEEALANNQEVYAQVYVSIDAGREKLEYEQRVTENAYDVFSLPEPSVGSDLQASPDANGVQDKAFTD